MLTGVIRTVQMVNLRQYINAPKTLGYIHMIASAFIFKKLFEWSFTQVVHLQEQCFSIILAVLLHHSCEPIVAGKCVHVSLLH